MSNKHPNEIANAIVSDSYWLNQREINRIKQSRVIDYDNQLQLFFHKKIGVPMLAGTVNRLMSFGPTYGPDIIRLELFN